MAATNTTPGTALDLAPLGTVVNIPAADVQGAPDGTLYASTCDSTQHHALWFKYTTGTNDVMLAVGIKGAEAGDAYHPRMSVWTGTPPSVTQHKVLTATGGLLNNLCANFATAVSRSDIWYFSFPVSANTTYYFQVTDINATTVTTDLNIVGISAPTGKAKPGDYLIINDAGPFPGAVVDQTTGELLGYYGNLGVGEEGDSLQSGQMAFQDSSANAGAGGTQIVARDLSTIAAVNIVAESILTSATNFYVMTSTGDTEHVHLVKPDGTLGAVVDVPNVGVPLLISPDGATFYYVDDSTFTLVKRWDLVNNVAMTDFAGDFSGAEPTYAFISGRTNTIVIVYVGVSKIMRQWSPDGTLLRTDTLTIATFNRLIGDLGSDTFQTWNGSTSMHRYGIWEPNTELVSVTTSGAQSSNGGPQNVPYAISTSCPLIVVPSAAPILQQVFVGTRQTLKVRRERTVPIPVLPGNARQKISRLELQFQPGTGLPADPTTSPNFFVRMSWDNGKTWSNERLMSAGREGAYITRAFVNILGSGRFPVVQLVTSDTFLPVLTNCFFTGAEGAH